jgi:hypothetical protein
VPITYASLSITETRFVILGEIIVFPPAKVQSSKFLSLLVTLKNWLATDSTTSELLFTKFIRKTELKMTLLACKA